MQFRQLIKFYNKREKCNMYLFLLYKPVAQDFLLNRRISISYFICISTVYFLFMLPDDTVTYVNRDGKSNNKKCTKEIGFIQIILK